MAKATKEKLWSAVAVLTVAQIGWLGHDLAWWLRVVNVVFVSVAFALRQLVYRRSSDRVLFGFMFTFFAIFLGTGVVQGRPGLWPLQVVWCVVWSIYVWRFERARPLRATHGLDSSTLP